MVSVEKNLDGLERDHIVQRIWGRDHTVWRDDPSEIADRLGWLDAPASMRARVKDVRDAAERAIGDGYTDAVLLGMGGSSLAAETLASALGPTSGGLRLRVLDSTHPDAVARVERTIDPRRTLFVVASKSGTTVETLCHLQYFYARIRNGSHFLAITDPGTPLDRLAQSHDFRGPFLNPPDVGGRFSALTFFGLVPAALMGIDVDTLLEGGAFMADACRTAAAGNPGAQLGATIAAAETLSLPSTAPGPWIEQLVAESTGKDGRGILPLPGESRETGEQDASALGAQFFRWMFATAVAGHLLGVHPFDQPDVAEAKAATQRILDAGGAPAPVIDDAAAVLDPVPRYLAICAFVDPSPENAARLESVRAALRDRLGIPVTASFGPRYLHSTGQLHKGGPPGGAFLVVTDAERATDAVVPGRNLSFGTLIDAQAQGDVESLQARGRRVARTTMQALAALA